MLPRQSRVESLYIWRRKNYKTIIILTLWNFYSNNPVKQMINLMAADYTVYLKCHISYSKNSTHFDLYQQHNLVIIVFLVCRPFTVM